MLTSRPARLREHRVPLQHHGQALVLPCARRRARTSARTRRRPTSSLRSTTRRSRRRRSPAVATHFGHLHEINPVAASSTTAMSTSIQSSPAAPISVSTRCRSWRSSRRPSKRWARASRPRRYEVMKNTVGLGGRSRCAIYPFDLVARGHHRPVQGKRNEVGALNVRAARLAFDHVKTNFDIAGFPTR